MGQIYLLDTFFQTRRDSLFQKTISRYCPFNGGHWPDLCMGLWACEGLATLLALGVSLFLAQETAPHSFSQPAIVRIVSQCKNWNQGLQRYVVYLCWPNSALKYESQCGGMEGCCGVSANDYSCAHHVTWSPNKLWKTYDWNGRRTFL